MDNFLRNCSTLAALALLLTGCAMNSAPPGGPHLSATECHDLAALRSNSPPTRAQLRTELGALRRAGYNPSPWNDDRNFPEDLQAAQRLVDHWFETECK